MRRFALNALCLAAVLTCLQSASAIAALITPGNLVIYRVGDGTAALGTTATAVFLDEYTKTGSLVQSIVVPTTGTSALTAQGNATTEGIISTSQDGTTLVYTGYRKAAGGTNPSSDAPATTNRVIGTLTLAGTPDTSIALTNPTGTIRSATTVGGATYYVGTSAQVGYVAAPSGAATVTSIDARNSRQVNLADNTLYASNGSTTITGKVQTYGTLPTGTTAATPIVTLATGDAVNGFFLVDLSSAVAGSDTLYALSTVANQLLKYSFDGTAWTASGSLTLAATAATGASNLAGVVNGTSVDIYLTSSGSLSTMTDASGYAGTLAGTFSLLASATANTGFRGIAVTVPEPGAVLFGCLVCSIAGLAMTRRAIASRKSA